jgi:hypothetical protein
MTRSPNASTLTVVAVLLVGLPAHADYTLKCALNTSIQRISDKLTPFFYDSMIGMTGPFTTTMYYSGHMEKVVSTGWMKDEVGFTNCNTGTTTIFDTAEREYSVTKTPNFNPTSRKIPLGDVPNRMARSSSDYVVKSTNTKFLFGQKANLYISYWHSAYGTLFGKYWLLPVVPNGLPVQAGPSNLNGGLGGIKGFCVESHSTTTFTEMGIRQTTSYKVISMSSAPLSPAMFQMPTGYTKITLPLPGSLPMQLKKTAAHTPLSSPVSH